MKNFPKSNLISILCLLVLVSFASEAFSVHNWTDKGSDNRWSNPANWDKGTVPGASDMVGISLSESHTVVDSVAECWGTAGPGHSLDIFDSNLHIVPGGSLTIKCDNWTERLLVAYSGEGIVNIYEGGSLTVETVQCRVAVSEGARGEFNIYGGSFYVGGALELPKEFNAGTPTGEAVMNLQAGVVDVGFLDMGTQGRGSIDITEGILKIRSNQANTILSLVNAGLITAYGGEGVVLFDYNRTNAGVTTVWASKGEMVAYYDFEEGSGSTVYDKTDNPLNGTVVGTPQWKSVNEFALTGTAMEFDGDDDYIAVGDAPKFAFTTQMTVAAWFRVDAFTSQWQALVTKADNGWGLMRHNWNNTMKLTFRNPDNTIYDIPTTTNVNDGKWHHIAGVYDGTSAKIYLDGVLENQIPATGLVNSTANNPIWIGGNSASWAGGRDWKGDIDEVRIYNYALNSKEIAHIAAPQDNKNGYVWDVKDSFSQTSSKKGAWSYGIAVGKPNEFYSLENYVDPYASQSGLIAWQSAGFPANNVVKNTTQNVLEYLQPGQIGLVASGNRATVVRWTSPGNGAVRIQGTFNTGEPGADYGYWISWENATANTLYHVNTEAYAAESFDYTINVSVGDVLEFRTTLGSPDPTQNEIVPFDCTITAQDGFGNMVGWDVVEDFSLEQNPSGQWSYGYVLRELWEENEFVLYPRLATDPNEDDDLREGTVAWKDFYAHKLLANPDNSVIGAFASGLNSNSRIALRGSWTADSVARWKSPGYGSVFVSGCFGQGATNGASRAIIVKNTDTVIEDEVIYVGDNKGLLFGFEVEVEYGDTLDFIANIHTIEPDSDTTLSCLIYPIYDDFVYHEPQLFASEPSVADGSEGASAYPLLTWKKGSTSQSRDVYFGTDESLVANGQAPLSDFNADGVIDVDDLVMFAAYWLDDSQAAQYFNLAGTSRIDLLDFAVFGADWAGQASNVYQGNFATTMFEPGMLEYGLTYYWRVDEIDSQGNVYQGDVWSFTVGLAEDTAVVLNNPDMGWVLQDVYATSAEDSSMILEPDFNYEGIDFVTILFGWADVETSEGVYDFTDVDFVYDYWKAKDKNITLRMTTESWLIWNETDIPQYVLDEMLSSEKQQRTMNNRDYLVVDMRNSYYLTRLQSFLEQCAAHFAPNGNRPVDWVDLRGFGAWGEWHSGFIYPTNSDRINALKGVIDVWSDAFSEHILMLSYSHDPDSPSSYYAGPVTHYDPAYIYDYDDYLEYSAFNYALGIDNISWRRDGFGGAVRSNQRKLANDTFDLLSKWGFVSELGGSFNDFARYAENGRLFTPDTAIDDMLSANPNYMQIPGWDEHRAKLFMLSRPDLFERGLREVGYRFVPSSATIPSTVSQGQNLNVSVEWQNPASGRAMADYEMRFVVRSLSGGYISTTNIGAVNTSVWINGGSYTTNASISTSQLATGSYRLCVSMFDTRTNKSIALPLHNKFYNGYELGIFEVE